MRNDILKSRRTYLTLTILALLILLALLPLSTRITAPGVLYPREFARLYPSEPGRIASIRAEAGQTVRAGDPLFVIDAPEVVEELKIVDVEIELAQLRLARIGANMDDLAQRSVLESELSSLEARKRRLVVASPFDGKITGRPGDVRPGQWVGRSEQLAFLSTDNGSVVRGYVSGIDSRRVTLGASGWFVPDDLTVPKFRIRLSALAQAGVGEIDIPQLTSQHHGPIAVHPPQPGERPRLVPVSAQYAVTAEAVDNPTMPGRSLQGVMLLDGEGQSLAERAWRRVLTVFLREAGF